MAWESATWACGHEGSIQLYGKQSGRDARIASEAGRKCFACWLIEVWKKENDPRALREDRFELAKAIAENKGFRICGVEIVNEKPVDRQKDVGHAASIMLDMLAHCRAWFEKYSPTAELIIEGKHGEHPMLTSINKAIKIASDADIVACLDEW